MDGNVTGSAEIGRLDTAGLDIERRIRRGGHCGTGR